MSDKGERIGATGDKTAAEHYVSDHLDRPGLSLKGESGYDVVVKAARLALGSLSLKDLNDPRYGLSPDGTPQVRVDEETFRALSAEA